MIVVLCPLVLLVGAWQGFFAFMYNENINQRFESYEPLRLHVGDFDGLQCTEYKFPSDKGQMLAGYLYSASSVPRGIIIIAHGYGGGHNSYMDGANYFA